MYKPKFIHIYIYVHLGLFIIYIHIYIYIYKPKVIVGQLLHHEMYVYINSVVVLQAKEAEKQAMVEGIKENGTEDADKVARAVLAERHAREVSDLDQQFSAEKKIMVDDALNRVNDKYEKRRTDMLKRHEDELVALQVSRSVGQSVSRSAR